MFTPRSRYASALRQELIAKNNSYAALNRLPHVTPMANCQLLSMTNRNAVGITGISFRPATEQFSEGHGGENDYKRCTATGARSLPPKDEIWRELDSSLSSDALLMNIFCYPGVTRKVEVRRILCLEPRSVPEFGFMPRVPLLNDATEHTEIDMKLGNMLFEAKLTEGNFQIERAELVERYRDLSIMLNALLLYPDRPYGLGKLFGTEIDEDGRRQRFLIADPKTWPIISSMQRSVSWSMRSRENWRRAEGARFSRFTPRSGT